MVTERGGRLQATHVETEAMDPRLLCFAAFCHVAEFASIVQVRVCQSRSSSHISQREIK